MGCGKPKDVITKKWKFKRTKSSDSEGLGEKISVLKQEATREGVLTGPHASYQYSFKRVLYLGGKDIAAISFLPVTFTLLLMLITSCNLNFASVVTNCLKR